MKFNQVLLRIWLILVMISLIQNFVFSQKSNQYWTTPIQNVEFTESQIIVTNSWEALQDIVGIKPVHYDISLVRMQSVRGIGSYDWDEYRNYMKQLEEYVNSWEISQANNRDKQMFLEKSVLLILLKAPINIPLPENIPLILEYLERDVMKDVQHNTSMVKALYDSYFKKS